MFDMEQSAPYPKSSITHKLYVCCLLSDSQGQSPRDMVKRYIHMKITQNTLHSRGLNLFNTLLGNTYIITHESRLGFAKPNMQ